MPNLCTYYTIIIFFREEDKVTFSMSACKKCVLEIHNQLVIEVTLTDNITKRYNYTYQPDPKITRITPDATIYRYTLPASFKPLV